jgi:hypothetical protein
MTGVRLDSYLRIRRNKEFTHLHCTMLIEVCFVPLTSCRVCRIVNASRYGREYQYCQMCHTSNEKDRIDNAACRVDHALLEM